MLTLYNVSLSLEGNPVLHNVDLKLDPGEIFCLLGPSGSGKSSLLRVVAGLERPDEGMVLFDGERITHLAANERGFGLMFQNYALFPHMNVEQNVMFGLKMRKYPRREAETRVREVLELVELTDFRDRPISKISGGQQQRVALARSLAPNPRLLMLDEPLASLDEALSRQLMLDLRRIIKEVGLTALYVTHNQNEAFAIGDRVGIMNEGRIEQIGTSRSLYAEPQTIFTARFLGLTNIIPIQSHEGGQAHTAIGEFAVNGDSTAVLIHPDSIQIVPPDTPGAINAKIIDRAFQGNYYKTRARVASDLIFTFKMSALDPLVPDVGMEIGLVYDDAAVYGLVG